MTALTLGIVGLGAIGGSLGLDWRSRGHCVIGVSHRSQTCDRALELGAVDRASTDAGWLQDADLVVLCTPIHLTASVAADIARYLRPDAVLTDAASVKQSIVESLTPLHPHFVGGHPMAGTESSGIEAAVPGLFAHRPYVLTPTSRTSERAIATVEAFARTLNAEVYHCNPEDHDRAVAWISHLPIFISAGLIEACLTEPNRAILDLARQFASSGFRDTSRVGGGNPELGTMMARFNRDAVLNALQTYRRCLDRAIDDIEQERWGNITDSLQRTRAYRPDFVRPRDC